MSNDTLTIKFDSYPNGAGSSFAKTIVTSTYSIYVLDCNDDDAPEPDYEYVSVPGRNGDLTLWNGKYKNKMITYECLCTNNARTNVPAFFNDVLTQTGPARLEDTLHTDYFKKGVFVGNTPPGYTDGGKCARFSITFNCQPQKWLFSGEQEIVLTTSTRNYSVPTRFPFRPLLKIQGYGSAYFNGNLVIIRVFRPADSGTEVGSDNYLMFDAEMNYAYKSNTKESLNSNITLYSVNTYHQIYEMKFQGSIFQARTASTLTVSVIPRWWKI